MNVAAYTQTRSLEETTIDQIRAEVETNRFGTIAVTKAVLPGMRARGWGTGERGRSDPDIVGAQCFEGAEAGSDR